MTQNASKLLFCVHFSLRSLPRSTLQTAGNTTWEQHLLTAAQSTTWANTFQHNLRQHHGAAPMAAGTAPQTAPCQQHTETTPSLRTAPCGSGILRQPNRVPRQPRLFFSEIKTYSSETKQFGNYHRIFRKRSSSETKTCSFETKRSFSETKFFRNWKPFFGYQKVFFRIQRLRKQKWFSSETKTYSSDATWPRVRQLFPFLLEVRTPIVSSYLGRKFNCENPRVAWGLEAHAVDLAAGWLEALVRILRGATGSAAVGGDWRIVHGKEILGTRGFKKC